MQQKTLLKIKGKEFLRKESFDYKIYEVTPSRFIEASPKALEEILNTMIAIYEDKLQYDYLNKSLVYIEPNPIFYEIFYEDKKIHFSYIIPDKYQKILVNKIDKVYRTATVKEREDYFNIFTNKCYCSFHQKKHFMFSLNSDYREHGLIDGIMSVLNNLQENDNVLLQIGIIPLNENWKDQWKEANIKHKNGEDLTIHTNPFFFICDNIIKTSENLLTVFDNFFNIEESKKQNDKIQRQMDRMGTFRNSHMTTAKINFHGFQIQIRVYCDNETRIRYYSKIFDGIFKILDADQELEIGKIKVEKNKKRNYDFQITKNIWSTKELAHFLKLPDRKMQVDYKENMKAIEITENIVPNELTTKGSKIRVGEATYKGNQFMTYYPNDFAMRAMSKLFVAPSRGGKTTLIKNFVIDAIKNGDSAIVIDTIRNCEVVEDVRDYMPIEYRDKLIILDYSNIRYLLPLAFNEITDVKFEDKLNQMMSASHLSGSLIGFIDSIAGFDKEDKLSPRMKKFLSCSGKICLSQPNSTIKDVLDVLIEADIRDRFIRASNLPENNMMVQELRHLDDGKGGTNYKLISGIIDRASALTNDFATEILISTPSNPEINFTKFANDGMCVLIKLSEEVFDREALRPLVTFLYFKIWLAVATARAKQNNPRLCHLVLDEIHNYPEILGFLSKKVKEGAKFGLSFVLTSHLLTDMKSLLPNFKAAGANFILIGGTSRENLKILETELNQEGIELEEAMRTKRYHSLNLINYGSQYTAFTGKLPNTLDKQYQKHDRKYLDLEFSKKFGVPFDL